MSTTKAKPLNLKAFCGHHGSAIGCWLDLRRPFVRNGFRYATDGHICVRVQTKAKRNTKAGRLPFPSQVVDPLFAQPSKGARKRWPGRRSVTRNVDPAGVAYVVIGKHHRIDARYDALIRSLPGIVRFGLVSAHDTPLPFFFRGGEGYVMGRNYEKVPA